MVRPERSGGLSKWLWAGRRPKAAELSKAAVGRLGAGVAAKLRARQRQAVPSLSTVAGSHGTVHSPSLGQRDGLKGRGELWSETGEPSNGRAKLLSAEAKVEPPGVRPTAPRTDRTMG